MISIAMILIEHNARIVNDAAQLRVAAVVTLSMVHFSSNPRCLGPQWCGSRYCGGQQRIFYD